MSVNTVGRRARSCMGALDPSDLRADKNSSGADPLTLV
jgi:hypothetical protein